MTHFYADVWVSKDGRAHIEVPKRHRIDFPAGTHVYVEAIIREPYATIRKHRQHSERFPAKTDVVVEVV